VLTFLSCIFVVDILTHAYMRLHHFQHYRASMAHFLDVFPLRPQVLLSTHRSPVENLTYWYRPHTSRTELPILFLHGIGVGLYPYMEFLKELNQGRRPEDGVIGVLAVEIVPISSRITSPLPRKQEMCQQLQAILQHHGFERYILVSHSSVYPHLTTVEIHLLTS
jgi:triacylglycerol esterase/lipase EstA (alpha/beta hydrolase family)